MDPLLKGLPAFLRSALQVGAITIISSIMIWLVYTLVTDVRTATSDLPAHITEQRQNAIVQQETCVAVNILANRDYKKCIDAKAESR